MRPDQAQDQVLPTRIIHLPLAFNDKWTHDAIAKYMKSVRKDAPYVPSNVDFVAANNGALPLLEQFRGKKNFVMQTPSLLKKGLHF